MQPLNPNQNINPPTPEIVPGPNQPLSQQEWANDCDELDRIMSEMSDLEAEAATIDENERTNYYHPTNATLNAQIAQEFRNGSSNSSLPSLQQRRAANGNRLVGLVSRSDTSAMLDLLDENVQIAAGHHQTTHDRVHGARGTIAAAQQAESEHVLRRATHRGVHHNLALDPITNYTGQARKDEEKRRAALVAASSSQLSGAAVKAGTAELERADSVYAHERNMGFHGRLAGLVGNLRGNHDQIGNQLAQDLQGINRQLNSLDLRQAQLPANVEQQLRIDLEGMVMDMGNLSNHDALRSLALAQYTRARARLEAQGIHTDAVTGTRQHNAEYTADGGIRLHTGTDDEVIVYRDGTAIHYDPQQGRHDVRRHASGEVFVEQPLELSLDDNVAVPINPRTGQPFTSGEAFVEWEASGNPDAIATLHAALGNDIRQQQDFERQTLEAIQACHTNTTTLSDRISQINATAQAENRAVTPQEQQQITDAQQQIATLRAQEQRANQNILAVRERISRNTYWRSFAEVGSNRVQTTRQGRLGRFMAKQVAAPVAGLAPELHPDGVVVAYDTTMHGRTGEWTLWPDGYSIYRDPSTRQTQRFRPNGTPA